MTISQRREAAASDVKRGIADASAGMSRPLQNVASAAVPPDAKRGSTLTIEPDPSKKRHPSVEHTRSTKVFQVGSGWFPELKGGAENVFFNLYKGLGTRGFDVSGIVASSRDLKAETGGMMRGFATKDVSMPSRALAIRRSANAIFASAEPDIIASHFALYSLPLLDRLFRRPVVTHFHGPWAMESAIEGSSALSVRAKKAVEMMIYRRTDKFIVLSTAFADLLQRHYGVADSLIRRVPGGVDCDLFDSTLSKRDARATLGWDIDRPVIFAVRRLVRRMGLDRLIEAMTMLRELQTAGSQDAVLHIAGAGPERATLEAMVAARGLTDVIHFDGRIPEKLLPLAYRASDLSLMPTAELEGFGLVAIESLAAGTPVMVTPVGGLPEVVSELSENLVLQGVDARSIAQGIAAAIADAAFLPNSDACRRYARRNFDWSVIVPQVAAVYREVL